LLGILLKLLSNMKQFNLVFISILIIVLFAPCFAQKSKRIPNRAEKFATIRNNFVIDLPIEMEIIKKSGSTANLVESDRIGKCLPSNFLIYC
jgi:hypothetical protein